MAVAADGDLVAVVGEDHVGGAVGGGDEVVEGASVDGVVQRGESSAGSRSSASATVAATDALTAGPRDGGGSEWSRMCEPPPLALLDSDYQTTYAILHVPVMARCTGLSWSEPAVRVRD